MFIIQVMRARIETGFRDKCGRDIYYRSFLGSDDGKWYHVVEDYNLGVVIVETKTGTVEKLTVEIARSLELIEARTVYGTEDTLYQTSETS